MAAKDAMSIGVLVDRATVAVFAALPVVGLLAGPSFAVLVFGIGGLRWLCATLKPRSARTVDPVFLAMAAIFTALCWTSVAWSIVPGRSLRGAVQITAILVASLASLAGPPPTERVCAALGRFMPAAFGLGAIIIFADSVTGYQLHSLFAQGPMPATKYNRGAAYLLLIAWPLLARACRWHNRYTAILVAVSASAILAFALGITGRVAALAGGLVLLVALFSPAVARQALGSAAVVIAAVTPFLLRMLARNRAFIASHFFITPHLFQDGLHRLEIWDYMTARVLERPFLGWGLWSAAAVPISPAEISSYIYVSPQGIYPHNQWLQLWLETGVTGPAIALALVLAVLARARSSLPRPFQPFAYAAIASALTISLADFQTTTDSWWATLVASGYLFRAFGSERVSREEMDGRGTVSV